MSGLPEDLLLDVLSRLPTVCHLRFRCVSKSWRALIDSSSFVKLHLNKSLNDTKSPKFIAAGEYHSFEPNDCIFYAINFNSGFKNPNIQEIEPPIRNRFHSTTFIGSCRSLVCFRCFWDVVVLWNPSTRCHRILPPTPIEIEGSPSKKFADYDFHFGFGYDDVIDDHIVVRLAVKFENRRCEIKVYSLKLDSWRKIENCPPCLDSVNWLNDPVLANGSMNWLVREKKSDPTWSLLAICLRTEVCRMVSLPECFNDYCKMRWGCCFHCQLAVVGKIKDYEKSEFSSKFTLPPYDSAEARVSCEKGQHYKWCDGRKSVQETLASKSIYLRKWVTCWVDSLVNLQRRKIRWKRASNAAKTKVTGEKFKKQRTKYRR